MKFLKIENNKGYYIKDKATPTEFTEIDKIEKNDLMNLLNYAIEEEFEMDPYVVEKIQHKAHQIIYKHLFGKFQTLLHNKDRFKDESEIIYKEALEKYQ